MAPTKTGDEATATTSKEASLEQLQQLLKTLPLEQLKLLKGNIFDNLDVLNQKKDSTPGTSDKSATKPDEGKIDEIVEKENTDKADSDIVMVDVSEEITTDKTKDTDKMEEESTIKEYETSKVTENQAVPEKKAIPEKKMEDCEIICLDDESDEEDEKAKEAAAKSTKSTVPEEKPKEVCEKQAEIAEKKDTPNKKVFSKECINSNCEKNIDSYSIAPGFVLSFYYVTKKPGNQYVCDECFDNCCTKLEELHANLKDKKCIFDMKLAQPADLVEILDSDDDEADEMDLEENKENYLSNEELWLAHDECDEILEKIIKSIDPQSQLEIAERFMKKKIAANDVLIGKLSKSLLQIEKKSMDMYNKLYSVNKVRIQERPPVEFIGGFDPEPVKDDVTQKTKSSAAAQRNQHIRQQQMQKQKMEIMEQQMKQKMMAKQMENLSKYKSPPKSNESAQKVAKPDLGKAQFFAMRPRPANTWSPCQVLDEKTVEGVKLYHVKFLDNKPSTGTINAQVTGKHLANANDKSILGVGRRVLAIFTILSNGRKQLAAGVIGESLTQSNRFRYLVFGDDGNVEYIAKDHVFPIVFQSKDVCDDVHINLKQFLREYLSSDTSKQRTVLIVRKGQRICIDRNEMPTYATVVDIDCSLMKLRYHNDTYELVYRGSKRLGPLKPNDNPQNSFQRRNVGPSMEYVTIDDTQTESSNPVRAVAKKSTSKPSNQLQPQQHHQQQQQQQQQQLVSSSAAPAQPGIRVKILNDNKIYIDDPTKVSRLRHFTPRRDIQAKKFVVHNCGPQCLPLKNSNLSSYSPLSKPLLTCWERQIVKQKNYKAIMYKTPCGRRLRNMNEVHHFLKVSKSPLNVENFDFDITMQVLAAYDVDKQLCGLYIDDITEGQEGMKIPVVNAFDNQKPPPLSYSAKRIPTTGVNINTDPEFLSCCDCTDDCFDKTKCQCFRLTIEGAKFNSIMEQPAEEISYVYKRLLHVVPTGIYECNSNCKCSSRCLNRVVQQPIQVKMQVFRTKNRGWGLETLHDIPKGTFICIYAGLLYTEKAANEMCQELEHGDEYFAELDHIETTFILKEGYEENVRDPEDDEKDDSEDSDFRADLEDYDNNDLDFITSASRAGPREMLTRSSSRVSRSNSTATDSGQSDSQKNQRQSTKQPVDNNNSDSDSEGELNADVRNLNLAAPKAIETVTRYDPRRFRKLFGPKERVYIMDAKTTGSVGRYFNHSCNPNLFVQNVFVDTHDPRFPWISFFSSVPIRAGEELTWNYNYEVGSVPNKVLYCECGAKNCRNRIF